MAVPTDRLMTAVHWHVTFYNWHASDEETGDVLTADVLKLQKRRVRIQKSEGGVGGLPHTAHHYLESICALFCSYENSALSRGYYCIYSGSSTRGRGSVGVWGWKS